MNNSKRYSTIWKVSEKPDFVNSADEPQSLFQRLNRIWSTPNQIIPLTTIMSVLAGWCFMFRRSPPLLGPFDPFKLNHHAPKYPIAFEASVAPPSKNYFSP